MSVASDGPFLWTIGCPVLEVLKGPKGKPSEWRVPLKNVSHLILRYTPLT